MGCGIVKKLLDLAHGVCCWAFLLRCDRAQVGKHRAVYSSCIVEECAAHLLEYFLSRLVEEVVVVLLLGVLSCHTVVWGKLWVGLISGCPWAGVFEARQCVFDVPWHGDVHLLFFVILVNGEPNVLCACPVLVDCIVFFEGFHEVFSVLPAHILNTEIVNA